MAHETKAQTLERVLNPAAVTDRLAAAAYQARDLAERLERAGAMWAGREGTLTARLQAARWVAQDAAAGVRR